MSLLESIHSGKREKPPRILIYGSEGIGKSTLAANAPNPIFIPTEDGVDNIVCDSFPLCRSLKNVMDALSALASEEHKYKTVVFDSCDWGERLVWEHICNLSNPPARSIAQAEGGYGNGYKKSSQIWHGEIVKAFRYLRDEKNMIVIFLAHSQIKKHEDPESAAFDRFIPRMHESSSSVLTEWCDAVLLATREFGAAKGDKAGGQRVLRCTPSAVGMAKNRYGLPDVIPLSWDALYQGIVGQ